MSVEIYVTMDRMFGKKIASLGLVALCLLAVGCEGGGSIASSGGTGGGSGSGSGGGSGSGSGSGGGSGSGSGGGTSSPTGKLALSINWPAAPGDATMPISANSATIELVGSGTDVFSPIQVKPTATYTFTGLGTGTYTYHIFAYAGTTRAGTPVGLGTGMVGVTDAKTTTLTANVASTLATIFTTGPSTLTVGTAQTASISGSDSLGQAITLYGPNVHWVSSDPSIATVSATGMTPTLTPVKKGNVTITATYDDRAATSAIASSAFPVTVIDNGIIIIGVH